MDKLSGDSLPAHGAAGSSSSSSSYFIHKAKYLCRDLFFN